MLPKTNSNKYYKKLKPFLDVRVLGLAVFGVIILLVSWSGLKVLQTNYELQKKINQLNQRNQVQQLQNENLKLKNKYYESDQYLELTVRRQFGKATPGERLYIVPPSVAYSKAAILPSEEVKAEQKAEQKSKYQQNLDDWRKFLFHRRK